MRLLSEYQSPPDRIVAIPRDGALKTLAEP